MSKVLEETGCTVLSSDRYDRGYGEVGLDFLTSNRYADNIVTNPPYNCAEGCRQRCEARAQEVCSAATAGLSRRRKSRTDNLLGMPAVTSLGLQREDHVLSDWSDGEGNQHDSLCLVRVG